MEAIVAEQTAGQMPGADVPRRGGRRAWGTVRPDFERALGGDRGDPAVALAEIASELRWGAGYIWGRRAHRPGR